ncbi:MAG: diguanylate cyclase [Quinella sp. 2Q5]|nr:diguanylate cyclase [Quinella sp. 2Q5]
MFKFEEMTIRLAIICAAGIALNVLGAFVAVTLHLEVYLDTLGTIFIAALGGYMPGIAVGFFTNLFATAFDSRNIYFGLVNVLVAVLTAFFAHRGYYKTLPKVLMTIPLLILVTSFSGALIEELMSLSNSFDSFASLAKLFRHMCDNFSNELPDKSVAILIVFFALKIIPPTVKENFHTLGKMQAPVPDEMRRAINTGNKFIASLRTKMVSQLLFVTIVIAGMISLISYNIYRDFAIRERIRIADGIITMVVNEINPRRVDDFLARGRDAEGYHDVERTLYKIRACNSDIKFLYVYKILDDGCHVVFDLDTAAIEASEPGSVEDFDGYFLERKDDLLAGRPIAPIIGTGEYGYLLTIYKPVYDSEGRCVCYAGIDFSMDQLNDYGRMFIAEVVAMFAGTLILIFVLSLTFIENNIILPVNTMAYCARNFAYDSEEARASNIDRMRKLDIRTHDEIENLYSAFLKTTSDSMNYFENLKRSKIQLAVMDELAHKDALTGLKNKTAYNKDTASLDADIAAGNAAFAIVMIDVNYLKRVNDTYGHERGNEYLINAAKLACKIFGTENVYRVGGDEFVAVLGGEDVARCDKCVANIRAAIELFRVNDKLQPWEKVSAAVGVAYCTNDDNSVEEVFKRADADMYKNKLAMKAVRRD